MDASNVVSPSLVQHDETAPASAKGNPGLCVVRRQMRLHKSAFATVTLSLSRKSMDAEWTGVSFVLGQSDPRKTFSWVTCLRHVASVLLTLSCVCCPGRTKTGHLEHKELSTAKSPYWICFVLRPYPCCTSSIEIQCLLTGTRTQRKGPTFQRVQSEPGISVRDE